jgi:hypothetical protein
MSDFNPIQLGFGTFFAATYVFAFRDATRRAAELGAFEFRSVLVARRKVVPYSVPILVVLPAVAYFAFASAVVSLVPKDANFIVWRQYTAPVVALVALGAFPWVPLHLWCLIAHWQIRGGVSEDQTGYGWVNTRCGAEMLPLRQYSVQVVVVSGMLLAAIVFWAGARDVVGVFTHRELMWGEIFTVLYLSQLIVLYQISLRRGLYAHAPQWVVSLRMMISILVTVLLPAVFGAAGLWPLVADLDRTQLPFWVLVPVLLALPFPFYCHQAMLIPAKHFSWTSSNGAVSTEIAEGITGFWWICAIFGVATSAIIVLIRNGLFVA